MLPIIRRHIFEPFHCLISGSPKLRYWKRLDKTQFFSETKLLEIQWNRLKNILSFVFDNNDFYKNRFMSVNLRPDDICLPQDLINLPILSKNDIRENTSTIMSKGFNINKLEKAKTGGSTGKPLELYFTENCSSLRNACTLRHDLWSGWRRGEPIAAIWGNPVYPSTIKDKIRTYFALPPMIYLDTMEVSNDSIKKFVEKWRRIKPTLIFGHAHSIYTLALMLDDMGIYDLNPKGIISSSMMLQMHERRIIENVFDQRVIDRYGCEEVGLIASECKNHEGMHLNIEHLFIEFIKDDGTTAEPGENGDIVITDLMNFAMPLIRYKVEDVGVPSNRRCSCGRGLPLMEGLKGRVADFLIKKDGTKVSGISLIENTLTKFKGIDQMQLIQESLNLIKLRIVKGKDYSQSIEDMLYGSFYLIFGNNLKIEFEYIKKILPEKSGKYRFSICKINNKNM